MTTRTVREYAWKQAERQKKTVRIAVAALRRIRRIGYGDGVRTEESEIALKALRRIRR